MKEKRIPIAHKKAPPQERDGAVWNSLQQTTSTTFTDYA